MAEWISVKERLPGVRLSVDIPEEQVKIYRSDRLLVYVKTDDESFVDTGEIAVVMNHDLHRLEWNAETFDGQITHWMPLPEPPKED